MEVFVIVIAADYYVLCWCQYRCSYLLGLLLGTKLLLLPIMTIAGIVAPACYDASIVAHAFVGFGFCHIYYHAHRVSVFCLICCRAHRVSVFCLTYYRVQGESPKFLLEKGFSTKTCFCPRPPFSTLAIPRRWAFPWGRTFPVRGSQVFQGLNIHAVLFGNDAIPERWCMVGSSMLLRDRSSLEPQTGSGVVFKQDKNDASSSVPDASSSVLPALTHD
ncbi:unnamed protein product [Prunus armeniaca]